MSSEDIFTQQIPTVKVANTEYYEHYNAEDLTARMMLEEAPPDVPIPCHTHTPQRYSGLCACGKWYLMRIDR